MIGFEGNYTQQTICINFSIHLIKSFQNHFGWILSSLSAENQWRHGNRKLFVYARIWKLHSQIYCTLISLLPVVRVRNTEMRSTSYHFLTQSCEISSFAPREDDVWIINFLGQNRDTTSARNQMWGLKTRNLSYYVFFLKYLILCVSLLESFQRGPN